MMILNIYFEDNDSLIDFCSKMNNDIPPEKFKEITAMYYIDNTINTLEEFVRYKISGRLNAIDYTFYKDVGIVHWLNNKNTISCAMITVKDINQLVSENFQKAGYAEVFLEKVKASKGKNNIYIIM